MFMEGVSYQYDDVVIETHRHRLLRAGQVVEIEPKAFRVLLYLAEHRDRVVPKDELVEAVWAGTFVSDNALTRLIAQLRKQLGDTAKDSRVIETVPTVGYRFLPELKPVRVSSRRWLWLLALIPLVATGFWWRRPGPAAEPSRLVQMTTSNGVDAYPSFSPDGGSLAYASDRSGHFEIYVRSLGQGGRELQVTNDGMENLQPVWSPDGRYLAFTSHQRGGIGLVPALGGVVRMLTEFGSQPAWSPDGTQLVFRSEGLYSLSPLDALPSGPSTLWIVNVAGGAPRPLTRKFSPRGGHSNPIWTDDGRILFLANTMFFHNELWSMDARGGPARALPMPVPLMGSPAYSASAGVLSFASQEGPGSPVLYRVGLRNGVIDSKAERLSALMAATMPREIAATRDGATLAVTLGVVGASLLEISAGGGPEHVLLRDTSFRNSTPAFSPDGSKIAYFSRRVGEPGDYWVMDADGQNARQLTTRIQGKRMPSWTPDSKELATLCDVNGKMKLCFTSMDGKVRSMEAGLATESWARLSPDGRRIAVQRDDEQGRSGVWVRDLTDGATRRITPEDASVGFPLWAPDGRTVVGELLTDAGSNLGVWPAGGGPVEMLTEGRGHAWPGSWAPDGDRLVFAGLRDGVWNLYWISLRTRQIRQLTKNDSFAVYMRYPAWSPNGDRIVFERGDVRSNIFLLQRP